jgi:hypothetical protein
LQKLDISSNRISSSGIKSLIESMKAGGNAVLLELNVSHNMLGREGGIAFASLIKSPKFNPETLDMSFNNLEGLGAEEIGKALETNKTITSLNLSGNKEINAEERRELRDAEGESRTVFRGLTTLLESLQKNQTITKLDLSERTCLNMTKDQALLCADNLRNKDCSIADLNLASNQLNSDTNELLFALKENESLERFNVGFNFYGALQAASGERRPASEASATTPCC